MVSYFIEQSLHEKSSKLFLLREEICSPQSYLFCQLSTAAAIITPAKFYEIFYVDTFCCKTKLFSSFSLFAIHGMEMTSHNVTFIDIIDALHHTVLNQNRNAVFI